MSFWHGFKRKLRLTPHKIAMSDKLTLDKARELLQEKDAEIQGLQARIAEFDQVFTLENLGIVRMEQDGKVLYENRKFAEIQTKFAKLEEEKATLEQAFTKADAQLTAANEKIAELEKKDSSVSNRAREFLASQGGQPLNISGKPVDQNKTETELSAAIAQANKAGDTETVKRLYGELNEMRKKR